MLGIIYLLLSTILGYLIVNRIFPNLASLTGYESLNRKKMELSAWMVVVPASFLVGTLLVGWLTYLLAYVCKVTGNPMLWGNAITFFVLLFSIAVVLLFQREQLKERLTSLGTYQQSKLEMALVAVVAVFWGLICFLTFYIKDGVIHTGYSVFGDFGPHLAVIRSFSEGANFPTQYPHFADGTIRYHFLFQFLVGNLEYLGLRLDWAFNLPSILAMVAFLMLLYSIAVILFHHRSIGILTVLFFFFRSSFAVFTYLATMNELSVGAKLAKIFATDKYIGNTINENWGLWNLNVYANQRHFAFALGLLAFIIIAVYPLFTKMITLLANVKTELDCAEIDQNQQEFEVVLQNKQEPWIKQWMNKFLFQKDAWLPQSYLRCVFLGILLGLMGFWNGAVVIATLVMLFVLALCSMHRLEYLIIAILSIILLNLESAFFIGSGKSVLSLSFYFGFLAEPKNLQGVISYYVEMAGLLPFAVVLSMFIMHKGGRWFALAFAMPAVVATTLSLTPDIVVNHKYVLITMIFINMFAAFFIQYLLEFRLFMVKLVAILMVCLMTATGLIDAITLYNLNKGTNTLNVSLNDPLTLWAEKNVKSDEIALSDLYSLHAYLLSGRKLFLGWPYYGWSAGYDTNARYEILKRIYSSKNLNEADNLIKSNHIAFVIIDEGNRNSKDYELNEALFQKNYPLVYEDKQTRMSIYRTAP